MQSIYQLLVHLLRRYMVIQNAVLKQGYWDNVLSTCKDVSEHCAATVKATERDTLHMLMV